MRYVKIVLVPEDTDPHPAAHPLWEDPDLRREAILYLNLLADGTAVTLSRVRGDCDRLVEMLDSTDAILRYDVTEQNRALHAYIHFEPNETARGLLELTQRHELVVDTPIEYGPDGSLRVAVIGDDDTVQRAIDEVPETIRVELQQLSDYNPELRELASLLTERQQEILDAAVRVGYYEVPRQATHKDIAAELELSTTTVGEHLRKIETRVLGEIAR